MTSLKNIWLASTALGCALASSAYAQSPQQDDEKTPNPTETPGETTTTDTTGTTTTTTTTTGTTTATPSGTTTTTVITPPPPPPPTTEIYVPPPEHAVVHEESFFTRIGVGIAAGGGAGGFINDNLRGATDPGGDWDVRAIFGTRSPLAVEASYIGSAQPISALGVDNNAVLVGNGVQGALRLNATFNLPVQPFAYAGAAWRRYDVTNTATNTSDLRDSDNVLEVPMGLGIAGHYEGLLLDMRGEFRLARNADLLPNTSATTLANSDFASMNRWGVNANIGMEF